MKDQVQRVKGVFKEECDGRTVVRASLDFIEQAEFSKTFVIGEECARVRMILELVVRDFEGGRSPLIFDFKGRYSPLIDYIQPIRVYKVGRTLVINPLREVFRGYSRAFASIFGGLYGLTRDERGYLAKALEAIYRSGNPEPTMDSLMERLLQMEAEAQPKEGYKIECLKNVLSEVEIGSTGPIFRGQSKDITAPAILDLSELMPRDRILVLSSSLMRVKGWKATSVVIDGMDWSVLVDAKEPRAIIGEWIEKLVGEEVMARIGAGSIAHPPISGTAYIFCDPIGLEEARWIRGATGGEATERWGCLDDGVGLVVTRRTAPFYLRFRNSNFRAVDEKEVVEHMRALGEDVEHIDSEVVRGAKMLEKVFRDKASLFYAKEFLRLVGEGRVPVEAVGAQKNATLRNVVKVLRRYFMVVEYMDGSGTKWYRLTKVGENALRETESDEGKACD